MAGSVNKCILIGNIGRDPEVRLFQNGGKVCNLSLATSESWTDKASGERKERTEWHRVVIFNERLADMAEKYVRKGSKVYIEGQIETRKYTDQSGVEKYTTEIVLRQFRGELTLLDKKGQDDGAEQENAVQSPARIARPAQPTTSGVSSRVAQPVGGGVGGFDPDINDEIPFGTCWQ